MAKNKHKLATHNNDTQDEDLLSFSGCIDESQEEMMVGMMRSVVASSHQQMQIAFGLTKLIVEKNNNEALKEEEILSIFKRANQVVNDSSPVRELFEK
jgi:hypothetical protein